MRMIVGFTLMIRMTMLMRTVVWVAGMVVGGFVSDMGIFVGMLMRVFMGMGVCMFMDVGHFPMTVLMGMSMIVLVRMLMPVSQFFLYE
jgi:hypothetical protein